MPAMDSKQQTWFYVQPDKCFEIGQHNQEDSAIQDLVHICSEEFAEWWRDLKAFVEKEMKDYI